MVSQRKQLWLATGNGRISFHHVYQRLDKSWRYLHIRVDHQVVLGINRGKAPVVSTCETIVAIQFNYLYCSIVAADITDRVIAALVVYNINSIVSIGQQVKFRKQCFE